MPVSAATPYIHHMNRYVSMLFIRYVSMQSKRDGTVHHFRGRTVVDAPVEHMAAVMREFDLFKVRCSLVLLNSFCFTVCFDVGMVVYRRRKEHGGCAAAPASALHAAAWPSVSC